ncbi:Nucleic-acid-binding protein from transposon X-element [Eumeta japonica]|uniref:Nucleic-acid-binding protein from transposon X-element n=1 Tax=Eumeta variegata TaxID=151549 RepID=A0A4C1U8R5_EUMVA|nr:Nucleic-acid-binding protein from transposon X-element [Eumeta japonica]
MGRRSLERLKYDHVVYGRSLTKALSEIGYEAPQDVVKKLIARVTPVSSRASSRATSPMKTNKNKRQASSSSDVGATCSDSTVVARDQPEMDIDPSSAPKPRANDAKPSPAAVQQTQTTSTAPVESTRNPASASKQVVTAKTAPRTGAKPIAPPRPKLPPPIFLRKGANFLQISADCTRLRINCSKAVRTADDGIKIHCQPLRLSVVSTNIVDFKVQFHTYALGEERKLKAVIRGIPTDFPVDEIQADLCGQGFPVHSVHRLCRRDGSPLWLVLTVLPRTEEAKNIFNNLNMVCGLSGIRVEAPNKKEDPGQCHRCQLYGHAAVNCHADPRCVKCLVPHWTRECPCTSESGEKPSCVNCFQQYTANYRGCPKAPKCISHNRPNPNRPKSRPVAPPRDLNNFPDLAGNKPTPRLPPLAPPPTRG